MGMLSRIGYTLRHSPHLRLCPSSFSSSGFLHTGHTRISSSCLSIMIDHSTPFPQPVRLSRDTSAVQIPSAARLCNTCLYGPGLNTSCQKTTIISLAIYFSSQARGPMAATIQDGNKIAADIRAEVAAELKTMSAAGIRDRKSVV